MQSRWRAPLITLAVIVVAVAGGTHFLATGSLRETLMALHGGHRGGGGGALAALHGGGAPATPADPGHVSIGIRLEAAGRDHDTWRVSDVTPDSVASEAGMKKDDVIATIDGKPIAGLTIEQIKEMLERPDGCAVGVLRGDRKLTVMLTPRA